MIAEQAGEYSGKRIVLEIARVSVSYCKTQGQGGRNALGV